MKISLVIPIYNESRSLPALINSIRHQTYPPDEIIFINGGSTDLSSQIVIDAAKADPRFKHILLGRTMPGTGRNIGTEMAVNDWVAYTDAGITLDHNWLLELVKSVEREPSVEIVYGNYTPEVTGSFSKIATFAYVTPKRIGETRGKSIASVLLKKMVWQKVGGFPNLRAAEDLLFMDAVEKLKVKTAFAPHANITWQLRFGWASTYKKFKLYSRSNILAGRQWDWHYGVLKQYLFLLPFIILSMVTTSWWLLILPFWLIARTFKRIFSHRFEFGCLPIFNPILFLGTSMMILLIDAATFHGWFEALIKDSKKSVHE